MSIGGDKRLPDSARTVCGCRAFKQVVIASGSKTLKNNILFFLNDER